MNEHRYFLSPIHSFFLIFAPNKQSRGEGYKPSQSINTYNFMDKKELSEIEALIKKYTLVGAKDVLNFEDAVLYTGISKSYLYKLTCNHDIPHFKPTGKLVYFDKKEIDDWLRHNRVLTNTEIKQKATAYIIERGIK